MVAVADIDISSFSRQQIIISKKKEQLQCKLKVNQNLITHTNGISLISGSFSCSRSQFIAASVVELPEITKKNL